MRDTALTIGQALKVAALPGSRGLIRKARDHDPTANNASFARALMVAAHHEASTPDPGRFRFDEVREHADAEAARRPGPSRHVAADLQRVGAPAGVALIDRDVAVVAPLIALAAVRLEQKAVDLHNAGDALWVGRCAPGLLGLAAQQGMHAAIDVAWQIGNGRPDVGDQIGVGK